MKFNPISEERQPQETLWRELTEEQSEYVTGGQKSPFLKGAADEIDDDIDPPDPPYWLHNFLKGWY